LTLSTPLPRHTQVLINCAGTSVAGAFEELPVEAFERMMVVNYLGSVYPTRVVLPAMKERRSGAIVFVSSQAGQVREPRIRGGK
jgi:3-dehydrosphinganine reductase